MTVSLGGQRLELRPSGAVLIGDTLVAADLHLGKERAFRQQGVPVPDGPSARTLSALATEIGAVRPTRLIFLGDLFHHPSAIAGSTFESLAAWIEAHPGITIVLVKGNHDRIPAPLASALETVHSMRIGSLTLVHESSEEMDAHIAGHVHPAIRITHGAQSERIRCFWRRGRGLILPSFGEFTGGVVVTPGDGDEIYVPVGAEVRRLPV